MKEVVKVAGKEVEKTVEKEVGRAVQNGGVAIAVRRDRAINRLDCDWGKEMVTESATGKSDDQESDWARPPADDPASCLRWPV